MEINLGVLDVPHLNWIGGKKTGESHLTIGDLATILEAKYHVMETFASVRRENIKSQVKDAMATRLTAELRGERDRGRALNKAFGQIEHMFRDFLVQKQMDGLVKGVPTQASLDGISHRFKKPNAKRPARPSFIDTGQYVAAFKAWQP